MLESLQQFGKEIGKELGRAWEGLSEGWRELLTRSSNALTRYTRSSEPPVAGSTADRATPSWGLLAGDVSDDGKNIVVRVELPGVDRDDCDIVVDGSTLYIRGEKRHDVEHVGHSYYVRQCAYGSFQRAISLPHSVDASRAEAIYRNGVLTVKLPKAAAAEPHRIAVK
jgi:HSP20 family protein